MDPARADRLDALDGLRGLLALWVAVTHVLCWCGYSEVAAPAALNRVWQAFVFARPAVDVFVVLSGFAIASLVVRKPQPFGQYLFRRAARIYPTYLVCLALGLLTMGLTPLVLDRAAWATQPFFGWVRFASDSERQATLAHLGWHLTLLHGMAARDAWPDATATLLTPAWSVSLEWQFYLLAPTIVRLSRRPAGAVALVAAAWLGATFCLVPWANPHAAFLPGKLGLFLVGIASQRLDAARRDRRTSLIVAGCGLAFLLNYHPAAMAVWAGVFWACRSERGVARRLRQTLESRPLATLGAASYPLYLVHWPLIVVGLWALLAFRPGATGPEALLVMTTVGVPVMLGAAWALHRRVEAPAMAWRGFVWRFPRQARFSGPVTAPASTQAR